MNVKDLVMILVNLDDELPIVVESERGKQIACAVSLFINTDGDVVVQIE